MRLNREQWTSALGVRERLFIIVLTQYAVLFMAGLACAAAIYLVFSPFSALLSASNATGLLAAGLSITYLLMHQCGAWKYSKSGIELPMKKRNTLLAWSRIANMVSIPIWTAASILGLFVTLSSSLCTQGSANDTDWRRTSVNDCNIQRASIGVTLVASFLSVLLFCMPATVKYPFAASLAGVHLRDHREEEILHLSAADWPSPSPPRERIPRCSYDTSIYTPSFQDTTPQQKNWLPKLGFDTLDGNHPGRTASSEDIQPLRYKESNLLTSPAVLRFFPGSSPLQSMRGHPHVERSATINTARSFVYSQLTTADSTTSKRASSASSLSDDSSFFSLLKSHPPMARTFSCSPAVPSIPKQYLKDLTTLTGCSQNQSIHTKSQPRTPSAQFWNYELEKEPIEQCLANENIAVSTPQQHFRRYNEISLDCKSPGKEDSVTKASLCRKNTTIIGDRVGKWTYESFRKGKSMEVSARHRCVLPPKSDEVEMESSSPSLDRCGRSMAVSSRSRTLVKKRQPANIARRKVVGNICAL